MAADRRGGPSRRVRRLTAIAYVTDDLSANVPIHLARRRAVRNRIPPAVTALVRVCLLNPIGRLLTATPIFLPSVADEEPYRLPVPILTAATAGELARYPRLADGEHPDLATAPVLRNWHPASRQQIALEGVIHGHPRIGEGRSELTSEVFALARDGKWARTLSRFYRLGCSSGKG